MPAPRARRRPPARPFASAFRRPGGTKRCRAGGSPRACPPSRIALPPPCLMRQTRGNVLPCACPPRIALPPPRAACMRHCGSSTTGRLPCTGRVGLPPLSRAERCARLPFCRPGRRCQRREGRARTGKGGSSRRQKAPAGRRTRSAPLGYPKLGGTAAPWPAAWARQPGAMPCALLEALPACLACRPARRVDAQNNVVRRTMPPIRFAGPCRARPPIRQSADAES